MPQDALSRIGLWGGVVGALSTATAFVWGLFVLVRRKDILDQQKLQLEQAHAIAAQAKEISDSWKELATVKDAKIQSLEGRLSALESTVAALRKDNRELQALNFEYQKRAHKLNSDLEITAGCCGKQDCAVYLRVQKELA